MNETGPAPMTLAKAAIGVCALGLLGLLMPFVNIPLGSGSLFSLSPGLAAFLLLLFLGLSCLPVVDVRAGTLRFTPWLAIPGLVGVLTSLLLVIVFSTAGSSGTLAGLAISSGLVSLGTGAVLMMLASAGLTAIGVYGFVLQNRTPSSWIPGPRPTPGFPPPGQPPLHRTPQAGTPTWGAQPSQPWGPPPGPRPVSRPASGPVPRPVPPHGQPDQPGRW